MSAVDISVVSISVVYISVNVHAMQAPPEISQVDYVFLTKHWRESFISYHFINSWMAFYKVVVPVNINKCKLYHPAWFYSTCLFIRLHLL